MTFIASRSIWLARCLDSGKLNPMLSRFGILFLCCFSILFSNALGAPLDGNRYTYLDGSDPFYVGRDFPKLATPQWIGEINVEAVVILAIDDMRDHRRYEEYLRPILDRLKKIDGRAPVSIFCNAADPNQPHLQTWLKEGLSLEIHTLSHPCPLLSRSNFVAAADTYHGCVDLMNQVPGNMPVAFRMPCCDSMNSPSPRFYAEIFNRTNRAGQFLTIDSSVMNISTPKDETIPKHLVMDGNGKEKFRKYLPFPSFVTTIEDYPYPYVIGKLGWEFPAMAPSDWEAQNLHGTNNPITVADWKAALEIAVQKQGTFTFIFHPHGWIRSEQIVEFIDHAEQTYGKKVKFLNFREAQDRLNNHLLAGNPLRQENGQDNGVRILDLNQDGFLDLVVGNEKTKMTRVWDPKERKWLDSIFPTTLASHDDNAGGSPTSVRFGSLGKELETIMVVRSETAANGWRFNGSEWMEDRSLLNGLTLPEGAVLASQGNRDRGVRLRDLDKDGICELIVANPTQRAVFSWSPEEKIWKKASFVIPKELALVDSEGRDNGLRFVDLNEDGYEDAVLSNEDSFAVYLFTPKAVPHLMWQAGWTQRIRSGKRGEAGEIPRIVRAGEHRNNGAWFHSGSMWIQNEETAHLPDKVDRRSFRELCAFDAPAPLSPEDSMKTISIIPGFSIELVAHEPLVQDPVAFEWGADGRLWVVEMGDYPVGVDGKGKAGGVVKFLEDLNGDGKYDRSTVFLDELSFPNGVMPWRKGVLITAAPDIIYAEDTNGDGKADVRKMLFSGFGLGNQQHRVNGFEYGLDNWVYGANGDSDGVIQLKAKGTKVNIRNRDFRFRPDEGLFETVPGSTQFGRRRDDWGNWFGNNNPAWLWHYHIPDHYLTRNPHVAVRDTERYLANYPESTRAFAISKPTQRFNWPDMVNTVTSANSPTPYRDELFGPEFASSIFISEPANNLIHREVLSPDGVSFTSKRAPGEEKREFLASTDIWFRPTMIRTGPDGAVYFADMYRLVIEHIEYGLPGMEKQVDLRAGHDKGRIYRFYPKGAAPRKITRLDRLSTAELVQSMDSPNGWQRDTVQRLLVHGGDKSCTPQLEALLLNTNQPKVRLQALCTLDGLSVLSEKHLLVALNDRDKNVREHAIRLSEPFLKNSPSNSAQSGELVEALLKRADDPEIRVRYQLAFSLGEWKDDRAGRALAQMAARDKENPELQTAILSSSAGHIRSILNSTLESNKNIKVSDGFIEQLVSIALLVKDDAATRGPLSAAARIEGDTVESWQFAIISGLLNALERRGESFEAFEKGAPRELKGEIEKLDLVFEKARLTASSSSAKESDRLRCIGILGRGRSNQESDIQTLGRLLDPKEPESVQKAALSGLSRLRTVNAAVALLNRWHSYSPKLRTEVLNIATSRPEWTGKLIDHIEEGVIPRSQIAPAVQQKLLNHPQSGVRNRAKKLFALEQSRDEVLVKNRRVLDLEGNSQKGAGLFTQHCAACHQLRGEGTSLGPDLSNFAGKPAELLLVSILNPNQAVEAPFVGYTAVTASDREFSGVIVGESANSITIRAAGGTEETILRTELKQLTSSGLSLMPEGFDQAMSPQDLADLIQFIIHPPIR